MRHYISWIACRTALLETQKAELERLVCLGSEISWTQVGCVVESRMGRFRSVALCLPNLMDPPRCCQERMAIPVVSCHRNTSVRLKSSPCPTNSKLVPSLFSSCRRL